MFLSFPFFRRFARASPVASFTRLGKGSVALRKALCVLAFGLCVGCGTTKFSDTSRTATEQLLISSAMEELVDEYDYSRLLGLKVFVKTANSSTDVDYLKSLVRQQLAANGAFVKDGEDSADYIVEIAPGAVGTNRYELMYGIPETTIPALGTITSATSIPEFALIKRTDQKAQVKLRMWAYNKTTGAIIWQSGVDTKSSQIRDRWVFGAGPFTTATYDKAGMRLGGDRALPQRKENGFEGEDVPSIQSSAFYEEIDEKAIERLQKIREEGLARVLEEAEKENAEEDKIETEEDAAAPQAEGEQAAETKDQSPSETTTAELNESAPENASGVETTETAPSPAPAASTPETLEVPPSPQKNALPTNGGEELDLGYDFTLKVGSVYAPNASLRR